MAAPASAMNWQPGGSIPPMWSTMPASAWGARAPPPGPGGVVLLRQQGVRAVLHRSAALRDARARRAGYGAVSRPGADRLPGPRRHPPDAERPAARGVRRAGGARGLSRPD